MFGTVDLNR